MSFSVWFRKWIDSFFKLITIDSKKYKSDAQRKKERERRLKAKYSTPNIYRTKKKRNRRRSSLSVQNERLIGALLKFTALSLGILFLPLGLFDWGRKSAKAKEASRGSSPRKSTAQNIRPKPSSNTPKASSIGNKTSVTSANTVSKESIPKEPTVMPKAETTEPPAKLDENTPKSIPKNPKDQYIRKRMIIAGSYYCDKKVLDLLEIGSYIKLEAEPDNPYDKDAIKLLFNDEKIGYIARQDSSPFITCLQLKRKVYGVITDIINEDGRTKYEYETWFDLNK